MNRAAARPVTRGVWLLGPAFVAAIAYVDPGNVAANLTGGARYGYLLVWVLVAANLIAALVQYQSAKLGLVSGRTMPEHLGERMRTPARIAFWGQAELVAAATDIAEVIGGAIALNLLFGLPLFVGGLIVGVVSMALLALQSRYGQRPFETVIIGLLTVIAVGFLAGLFISPPDGLSVLDGLIPRFDGTGSVLLAASMLGATVMPHAIYVHSALARDRHGRAGSADDRARLLRATKWDVVIALGLAGVVNIGMLLLAAVNLRDVAGTDTIAGAHAAIGSALGPGIALVFAIGLLASGLASTSVGSYAGATIMAGLIKRSIPVFVRRGVTLIPALIVLAVGVNPTWALVISQVFLSFGIPFALVPLLRLTNDPAIMGESVNRRPVRWALGVVVVLVVALNLALIVLTLAG
ncbi:Nramp family divalent metal transporter [Lacisediminihabitans profunda]|uniref:Mn(2+) uptake NRAMP transporter MntH n=1 Tax=Lacisediminihabitans profunda TaxID=2594790 RepID=A0A5C8USJ4_9MICO|nr:Nramp family divalent metal transporter [Lacisediminihabitans profunda]TXN31292.1 Mn(2+) uptake NRAMP transporter MntH [Lacisediminihabitans profunda]